MTCNGDEKICIELCETISEKHIDSTYDIVLADSHKPKLKIDINAGELINSI